MAPGESGSRPDLSSLRKKAGHVSYGREMCLDGAAPTGEVNDRDDEGDHQQNVNQAAGNVKAPSQ